MSNNTNLTIRHHDQLVYRVNLLVKNKLIKKNVGSVLLAISTFSNKNGVAYPSQYTLAKLTGYKRETISRLITRLANEKWLGKATRKLSKNVTRNTYKINIAKITKALGHYLNELNSKKPAKKTVKSDHMATPKNDHTNNTSYKDLTNNTAQPKTASQDLFSKVNRSEQNEIAHHEKLRLNSAKEKGLREYRIKNNLEKCPKQLAKEKKEALKRKRLADKRQPLVDRLRELEHKFMMPKFLQNLTTGLANELMTLRDELKFTLNHVANHNLQKFINQN